ncbi:MAG: chemotaxis protein CheR [Spirochaetales bacterium]|nr:chemotaxis protein CheR [Spirochaetales bacterium]
MELLRKYQLKQKDFLKLQDYIETYIGIKMPQEKKEFLESRLRKRLVYLGYDNYSQYCEYLFSHPDKSEFILLHDLVTTHKTDFFREIEHFDVLKKIVLPEMVQNKSHQDQTPFLLWSAGCSTGEEVYTIAMIAADFSFLHQNFSFKVLGSDISEDVLAKARKGIYDEEQILDIPENFRKRYLLKHKDSHQKIYRIVPNLRNLTQFSMYNLHQSKGHFIRHIDVIFCRNVIIYFKRDHQIQILAHLISHLRPMGYLFLGHAESVNYRNLGLSKIDSSVYQKRK